MARNKLIPFYLLPASWGLKGDAYSIAEAHYYYEDEELDRRLMDIACRYDSITKARQSIDLDLRYGHITKYLYDQRVAEFEIKDPEALRLRKLDIDAVHGKITPYEAARLKVVTKPGVEQDVALLEVDYQFHKLSKTMFEKQRAILLNEPWVAIINSGFDPEQGIDGVFFEFDWNDQWIDFLKLNGYIGHSAEQIVDDWFTDVCRSHNAAESAGLSSRLYRD